MRICRRGGLTSHAINPRNGLPQVASLHSAHLAMTVDLKHIDDTAFGGDGRGRPRPYTLAMSLFILFYTPRAKYSLKGIKLLKENCKKRLTIRIIYVKYVYERERYCEVTVKTGLDE
jgi:hypothetical protein